jgi:4-amino-4-deoxy-L-arabinose transferase-like glycosyltransferase
LEDHDSISYLKGTKAFLNFNLTEIINLKATATPFYPLFSSLFSLPGWSVEFGARLCSLVFSIALFFAIIGIGKRFTTTQSIGLGLLIISFNPVLIPLSFSVLSEPSYIAVIYLGLWLFWSQYENPTKAKGLLLGLVFALGFLDRTEGILFLVAIPAMQFVHFLFSRERRYGIRQFFIWFLLFLLSFSVLSFPQVWRVSHKMGTFAINGRQAWMAILNNPDGKSYEQKLHGLDYSPKEINLYYILSHPDVYNQLKSSVNLIDLAKKFVGNFTNLYTHQLSTFIGALGLIFFGFGVLSLINKGRLYEVFLVLAFLSITLFPALLHNIIMRHIAVIGPLMMLMGGVGIVYLSEVILDVNNYARRFPFLEKGLPFLFLVILLACFVSPFWKSIQSPTSNREYSPDDFKEPLAIIQKENETNQAKTRRIAARKGYFTYMTNATQVPLPYTDYEGLVRYCNLNEVDYIFLEYKVIREYPFLERFRKGETPDFQRLYAAGNSSFGSTIELYRFKRSTSF